MTTKPKLYIGVFRHEYGVDCFTFHFMPAGELKYPSPRKVVEHFNIDFEPEKGETFELVAAYGSNQETLNAAEIGRKTAASACWWEDGEEGWRADQSDDADHLDDRNNTAPPTMANTPATAEILLPCFGITIRLDGKPVARESGSGTITSDLKQGTTAEDVEYVAAIDALESLVLAHACAGIDVMQPPYIEGIETAVEAVANQYGP